MPSPSSHTMGIMRMRGVWRWVRALILMHGDPGKGMQGRRDGAVAVTYTDAEGHPAGDDGRPRPRPMPDTLVVAVTVLLPPHTAALIPDRHAALLLPASLPPVCTRLRGWAQGRKVLECHALICRMLVDGH